MMQEAVLSEMRAQRLDVSTRVKFVDPGEPITESRKMLCDLLRPEDAVQEKISSQVDESAKVLTSAAAIGQFDVG